MIFPLLLLTSSPAAIAAQPYPLGAPATVEGAELTVTRLLNATSANDDVAFEKIALGMAIMLAPDFGEPVSRAQFNETLKGCTAINVVGSDPFSKVPQLQSVHVNMRCQNAAHPQAVSMVAEFMADDEHVFAVFPGGVAKIWPASKP